MGNHHSGIEAYIPNGLGGVQTINFFMSTKRKVNPQVTDVSLSIHRKQAHSKDLTKRV